MHDDRATEGAEAPLSTRPTTRNTPRTAEDVAVGVEAGPFRESVDRAAGRALDGTVDSVVNRPTDHRPGTIGRRESPARLPDESTGATP